MKLIITLFLITISIIGFSQNFNTERNWSKNKKEILFGAGATQFLGDLGGRNKIGKDYSLADLDLPSTGINLFVGYRFRFHPNYATRSTLTVGLLRGSDEKTDEIVRNSRNLSFRAPIVELSQRMEWIVYKNEKFGNRYNIRKLHGMKEHNEQLYLFSGAALTFFQPQAKYNGAWTDLRPLKTEGQGLPGGPKEYSAVTAAIPFGIGFRTTLSGMWRIGVEAIYMKTFTDYMDDVSGVYYDPSLLASPQAAYLSNPAVQNSTWFRPGDQRGDIQKDAYFYVNVVISKNITYKNNSKYYRWKSRGSRAKF